MQSEGKDNVLTFKVPISSETYPSFLYIFLEDTSEKGSKVANAYESSPIKMFRDSLDCTASFCYVSLSKHL